MIGECKELYESWAKKRREVHQDVIYHQMLDDNRKVHQSILENYQELDMIGRVVKVDDDIKAYTFGFKLNENMFCVYLEIADLNVQGLPVFIFQSLCRDAALRDYQFINAMDDFELPNIRRTKMSYHPAVLLPSYVVTRKD